METLTAVLVGAIGIMFVIGLAMFTIHVVSSANEAVAEDTFNTSNDTIFGDPQPGSTMEEKAEKIKDPEIAPPELSG